MTELPYTPKSKYYFIYEGEVTEPHYFTGIRITASNEGINLPCNIDDIPKGEADVDETDILRMISIANSYVESVKKKRYHIDYFLQTILDPVCKQKRNEMSNNHYRNVFLPEIRSFRITIGQSLSDIIDEEGFIPLTKYNDAFDRSRKMLIDKYKIDIRNKVESKNITNKSVHDGDNICIIHDRDYSRSFDNTVYEKAVGAVDNLNVITRQKYRMIITYPKFELWLVMHNMPEKDIRKINRDYLKNYNGDNVCKLNDVGDPFREKTGPSQYVTNLYKHYFGLKEYSKQIPPETRKKLFSRIGHAIKMSENDFFKNDLLDLKTEPGTNMGILMKEIFSDDILKEIAGKK